MAWPTAIFLSVSAICVCVVVCVVLMIAADELQRKRRGE